MQQGDYTSAPYYQFSHHQNPNPNPNPSDPHPNNLYASAPPFTPNYAPSDYTNYHPSYPQNPDPIPPTAPPSFAPSSSTPNFNSPFESNPSYQQPQQQPYFPPYDHHQTPSNYAPPNPNSAPSLYNSASFSYTGGSSVPPIPTYEPPAYEPPVRPDQGGGYLDDRYGGSFNRSRSSDLGSDYYGKSGGNSRYEASGGNLRYEGSGGSDDGYGDGVYAYQGGKVEPYGARGTAPKSSNWAAFDDYGRSISFPSQKESSAGVKIVKAVPKVDTHEDVKGGGVQKFRVKLLAESGGQSTMDVLCQIGLDGIRMLDPNTSRTLRIYPLENITRCDRVDSSTFAFWSKSPVDIEPIRIRLQSNSYTTNTLLDTVTAATIQFKEMGGSRRPAEPLKTNEQTQDRKKVFGDWMNLIKPANEEKDHWVPDEAVTKCTACGTDFGAFIRKHHCRNCGDIFCDKCTHGRIALTADENAQPVRVCDRCMAEVSQRLTSAKESLSKPAVQSHEDLARKLQEELERNRKTSGSKSDGSARRMKEVACPICTVHLQVQVPSSGSETIECGVCQHPFLVSAH
ncbi:hypothetical protein PHAVU_009G018000 [Phaseolus vulgaris]|uniref:FYVE-type domain-containing protein n=1 Tax=Phaseolus vulgaris TaxID=3885 RepID=V7AR07_PHAVU|nr:hypothetical protein PHAVU_009G018000g [Phaseolus vulgaris]ESW08097.1 hypothetical protein PHAVU_009G018000g [Phaseolus vulgaris]